MMLYKDAGILDKNTGIPWEFVWYPYGWKIRNLYVEKIRGILESNWYNEWHFPDFLSTHGVDIMEKNIMPVRKNLYPIKGISSNNSRGGEYFLAPTHEISVSGAMKKYINYHKDLPLKILHIWPAFRKQYNQPFPFGLSKRNTYIECHNIQEDKKNAYAQVPLIQEITRKIIGDILALPFIESTRPGITNKPVSKMTIGMDVITPLMRTLHSWMVYVQEDIFTKAFGVESQWENGIRTNPHVIHFWFTDNLLMASILHSFHVWWLNKIILPDSIMPYHISITGIDSGSELSTKLFDSLEFHWLRFENIQTFEHGDRRNKKIIEQINTQNPYIHIRLSAKWYFEYRIPNSYVWTQIDIEGILKMIIHEKMERSNMLRVHRDQIQKNRVITCNNLNEVNELVASGKILEAPLVDDNDTILRMDTFIQWWEILGFNTTKWHHKCIYTWKDTQKKAFLSKRI